MPLAVIDPPQTANALAGVFSSSEQPSFVACYKLLSGRTNIENTITGKITTCRFDFQTLQRTRVNQITERQLCANLFSGEVPVEEGRLIIEKLRFQNRGFFDRLLGELTLCLSCNSKTMAVDQFLYFYRCLEYLSIAFPVFYFSRRSDFVRSHALLKEFFSDTKSGELKAIKKLSAFIANESEILRDLTVTFDLSGRHPVYVQEALNQINSRMEEGLKDRAEIGGDYFSIPFSDVPGFLIQSRNLLFHNSNSGQMNYSLHELGGAEILCDSFAKAGLHWLALTFLELIRDRASRV